MIAVELLYNPRDTFSKLFDSLVDCLKWVNLNSNIYTVPLEDSI